MTIENSTIQNSASQKLLAVTIDRHLNFNEHVSNLCETTSLKITALARVFPYMTLNQRRTYESLFYVKVWVLPTGTIAGQRIIELTHFTKEQCVLSTMISLFLLPNY